MATMLMMEGGGETATLTEGQKRSRRWISGSNKNTVVTTRQAAPHIRGLVEALDRELPNNAGQQKSGGITALAVAASRFLPDYTVESLKRRIYSILTEEFLSVNANLVEGLLLSQGITMRETDIIQLPGGMDAANERVAVYCELHERELPRSIRRQLAEDLFEFSLLMVHGAVEEELEEAA